MVNAGVLEDPLTGQQVVGFVSRGAALKLVDLRDRPRATVVFRSGWEWVAVEGDVTLAGLDDPRDGLDHTLTALLVRTVYAAAVGGTPEQWSELDTTMTVERHTAVLVAPGHVYPAQAPTRGLNRLRRRVNAPRVSCTCRRRSGLEGCTPVRSRLPAG